MKTLEEYKIEAVSEEKIKICNICAGKLSMRCAECRESECKQCPIVTGKCGHSFHLHCINTWLQGENTCALCAADWEQIG